jgi:hypothetical protein
MATAGVPPRIMGIGPAPATRKVLELTGLSLAQMDVIELNEAFAAQGLAVLRDLGLADDDPRVNPNGGAIALGHPLGASGARLATTAMNQLHSTGGRYALCTMCIGVGQGIALIDRARVAQNSLRSLAFASFRHAAASQSTKRACGAPPIALCSSATHKSPPPGTACREEPRVACGRVVRHLGLQGPGPACAGLRVRRRGAQAHAGCGSPQGEPSSESCPRSGSRVGCAAARPGEAELFASPRVASTAGHPAQRGAAVAARHRPAQGLASMPARANNDRPQSAVCCLQYVSRCSRPSRLRLVPTLSQSSPACCAMSCSASTTPSSIAFRPQT